MEMMEYIIKEQDCTSIISDYGLENYCPYWKNRKCLGNPQDCQLDEETLINVIREMSC